MSKLILLSLAISFCLIACMQNRKDIGETILVDKGVEIPISGCVEANEKIFGTSVNTIAFCKCLIPKFYEDLKNDSEKLRLLKEGKWAELSKEKKEIIAQYYQDCFSKTANVDSLSKMTITLSMAEKIKKGMKQQLVGSSIEKTNDIDKYCDCMIKSMQTDFTSKEIMSDNFTETEKYKKALEKCLSMTKKNN